MLLFNNTGSGWPDVVFAEPRLVGRVADEAHAFPLDLKGRVPATSSATTTGWGCTFGDKIYCLRHDLAHFVPYYNEPLMEQFGYDVPTTFEELQALSDKVAAEHPGYLLGTVRRRLDIPVVLRLQWLPLHELVDDAHHQDRP